jgi:hypothetical protein
MHGHKKCDSHAYLHMVYIYIYIYISLLTFASTYNANCLFKFGYCSVGVSLKHILLFQMLILSFHFLSSYIMCTSSFKNCIKELNNLQN